MSRTTEHGENIANQIQGEDAYGVRGDLTLADVWNIVDNLHSHFAFEEDGKEREHSDYDMKILQMFEKWMRELEGMDDDLPSI